MFGNTTRRRDVPLRFAVVDNTGARSASVDAEPTTSSRTQAAPAARTSPGSRASVRTCPRPSPGQNVNFNFTCDDVDTDVLSSDDDCDRANIRWRRLDDGATGGNFTMTGIDDNSNRAFDISFPAVAGRYVVEAQLGNEDGGFPTRHLERLVAHRWRRRELGGHHISTDPGLHRAPGRLSPRPAPR